MDYKKKYNEALKWMRELYPGLHGAIKEDAEHFFPELRESEDERIRKKCIAIISKWTTKDDRDECIAYLEKQKDQKPDIELIQQSWYMEGYQDREHNLEPEWIVKTGEGGPRYEENPKYGQPLAKEQKPAEKQDYSGLNDCERAIHRGFLAAGVENVPVGIIKETAKDCIAHFPWPTKWSEEDETRLTNIIIMLEEYLIHHYSKDDIDKSVAWLKSFRPHWKPSSLEKGALRTAIHILTEERNFPKAATQLQNILDAFEGVENRLDWKPSEEQMRGLKFFLDFHRSQRNAGTTNWREYDAVESLYEQLLKKL